MRHRSTTNSLRRWNLVDLNNGSNFVDRLPKESPDYNGSLTNIRVTLEELAKALAKRLAPAESSDKWGDVLVCLRNAHLIDKRQEQGLAGVYTFISQGAHAVVGLDESEFTRVGRSL